MEIAAAGSLAKSAAAAAVLHVNRLPHRSSYICIETACSSGRFFSSIVHMENNCFTEARPSVFIAPI